MQERRKFRRWQTRDKVYFNRQAGKQEELVLDISLGGMRLLLDNEFKVGSSLSGQFKITPNQEPFYIYAEVVWLQSVVDEAKRPCYEVGVRFSKVSTIPI